MSPLKIELKCFFTSVHTIVILDDLNILNMFDNDKIMNSPATITMYIYIYTNMHMH